METNSLDHAGPYPSKHVFLPASEEPQGYAPFGVLLVLWIAHVVATWGEATVFSGDYGRWLHEIERFARGEVLYRDFYWPFPPMAIWILGTLEQFLGTDLNPVRAVTVALSFLIYLEFVFYVQRLLPPKLSVGAVAAGFLLSAAYAQIGSNPLPTGMYTPAAPLGFLFLLSAVLMLFRVWEFGLRSEAALFGGLCALCILTKQDYWVPALYLLMANCGLWLRSGGPGDRPLAGVVAT